jgi:hypothetical protein
VTLEMLPSGLTLTETFTVPFFGDRSPHAFARPLIAATPAEIIERSSASGVSLFGFSPICNDGLFLGAGPLRNLAQHVPS